ncbi:hypothetical protein ACOME3_005777 [Neoechinorhynchus agilis]
MFTTSDNDGNQSAGSSNSATGNVSLCSISTDELPSLHSSFSSEYSTRGACLSYVSTPGPASESGYPDYNCRLRRCSNKWPYDQAIRPTCFDDDCIHNYVDEEDGEGLEGNLSPITDPPLTPAKTTTESVTCSSCNKQTTGQSTLLLYECQDDPSSAGYYKAQIICLRPLGSQMKNISSSSSGKTDNRAVQDGSRIPLIDRTVIEALLTRSLKLDASQMVPISTPIRRSESVGSIDVCKRPRFTSPEPPVNAITTTTTTTTTSDSTSTLKSLQRTIRIDEEMSSSIVSANATARLAKRQKPFVRSTRTSELREQLHRHRRDGNLEDRRDKNGKNSGIRRQWID